MKDRGLELLQNIRKNRDITTGGEVSVLLKEKMKFKRIKQCQYTSFEHTVVKVSIENNKSLLVISIYRVLSVPVTEFWWRLSSCLKPW